MWNTAGSHWTASTSNQNNHTSLIGCVVFFFFCLFTNAIHMKQLFFETLELFNQFIELCKQYRIKFEHYYKRQMFVVELPDDLTTDMFLLETGFAN